MKIFYRILFVIGALIALAFGGLYLYLYQQAPKYSGELHIPGINKETEVVFDKYGIPHIYAQNQEDAYFALGYVQAQDRLFQMVLYKRLVNGRAAEIFGEALIPTDKYFRTLGLAKLAQEAAERHFENSPEKEYHQASYAYLNGINAFIKAGNLPMEFDLIGFEPEEFQVADIYGSLNLTALGFSFAQKEDLILNYIYHDLGEEYFKALSTDFVPEIDVQQANISSLMSENLDKAMQSIGLPLWEGSNGWALAPSKTKSGKALLANDTHIGFSQPAVWYEAYIQYPGYEFYGSFLPTCPFGVVGHNRNLGFGLTIFPFDNMDYYMMEGYGDSATYLYTKDTLTYKIEESEIAVKDQESVPFIRKSTQIGPIINGIEPFVDSLYQTEVVLAWSIYHLEHTSLEALYDLDKAQNIQEFQSALPLIDIVGLNVMYADKDDNIAWWGCGKIPLRDSVSKSFLFLNSAKESDRTFGFQDFSRNPFLINPEKGFVATANNNPVLSGSHFQRGNYLPADRINRIQQKLSQKNDWTVEDAKNLQLDDISDVKSQLAHFMVDNLIDLPEDRKYREAATILKNWNGVYSVNALAPTIFSRMYYHLAQLIFADELGVILFEKARSSYLLKKNLPALIYDQHSPWWNNENNPKMSSRKEILTLAFMQTIDELRVELGEDLQKWKWGKVHQLTHEHAIGKKKPMDQVFNVGPFEIAGGNQVINKMEYALSDNAIHSVRSGPALRVIIDFAEVEQAVNISPTGQSGNFRSPHYADQAQLYVDGVYRNMLMDKKDLLENSPEILKLFPQ
ncbi:MAG: penicillin acylase family protein [Bacteroidetes bacterium 4572_77]|nr:MAG: penicillin acylase family protein [Bacteroidetes bacterium 4572_77]